MKIRVKSLILLAIIAIAGISFDSAYAINQERVDKIENKKAAIESKKTEKICDRIENVVTRLEEKIEKDGLVKLRERLEARETEMEENRNTRETNLEERRTTRDENREEFYSTLETKAGDDATKKAAVEKFKNAVEEAVKTRRTAIDSAKEKLNTGIDSAIDSRESSMEGLHNEFKNNVSAALSKAKNYCGEDVTSDELKNVMNQLKNDIKSARDSYREKIAETKKVQTTIQSLRETRKSEVKLAIENFKAAMKIAQEELRVAMGA